MPGNCCFNDTWLYKPEFKSWLQKSSDSKKAKCLLCLVVLDLTKMGVSALHSHMNGKKHKQRFEIRQKSLGIKSYLCDTIQKPQSQNINVSSSSGLDTVPSAPMDDMDPSALQHDGARRGISMDSFLLGKDSLKAEIIWVLKVCSAHYSFNSCSDVSVLFKTMFPDSDVARQFSLGETKAAYLCCFGIAPYFQNLVIEKMRKQEEFVLMFDESVNAKLHEKQLDFHVRYWDGDSVVSTYLHSEFLGHSTAEDMISAFESFSSLVRLPTQSLIQISMDGPNVNWKFYNLLCQQLKTDTNCSVLHTGSCGLHIVHGAFKSGSISSSWDVERILSSLYYLFKDSPARREDYKKVTHSDTFPLKFCSVRWLENSDVAARAIEIWPHIMNYVLGVKEKKVPDPKTRSFTVVKDAVNDILTPVKLTVFQSVAKLVQPFLTAYQSEKPMLPFLCKDLTKLILSLMERFIKADEIIKVTSTIKLLKLDISNKDIQVPPSKVQLGFVAENRVKELLHCQKVNQLDVLKLRGECRDFLVEIVKKLLKKSPLQYSIVRNLRSLDPREMKSERQCVIMFTSVLNALVEAHRVMESECDNLVSAYREYVLEFGCTAEFKNFNPAKENLENLLIHHALGSSYKSLERIFRMLLILSHGQASVERGFSFNRKIEVENMHERTVVAQRIINQHVSACGGVSNVPISRDLLLSAAGARQKWQTFLEEKRQRQTKKTKSAQFQQLSDKLCELKAKKRRIQVDIDSFIQSADKLSEKAESTGNLTFISKSNSYRRSAKDKQEELQLMEEDISAILGEIKNAH